MDDLLAGAVRVALRDLRPIKPRVGQLPLGRPVPVIHQLNRLDSYHCNGGSVLACATDALDLEMTRFASGPVSSTSASIGQTREIYDGLFDYEKHQDDKIGRFLAAIAFLATAGAAILIGNSNQFLTTQYRIADQSTVPVPGILLVAFFVLLALTLFVLITNLGPNITYAPNPPPLARRTAGLTKPSTSWLFFLPIARSDPLEWEAILRQFSGAIGAEAQLNRMYLRSSHNIAMNAEYKYHRNNEAHVTFGFALLFFAFAILLGSYGVFAGSSVHDGSPPTQRTISQRSSTLRVTDVSASGQTTPSVDTTHTLVDWDQRVRVLSAILLAAFITFQVYEWYRLRQKDKWSRTLFQAQAPSGKTTTRWLRRKFGRFKVLCGASIGFAFACVLPVDGDARWRAAIGVGLATAIGALAAGFLLTATDWGDDDTAGVGRRKALAATITAVSFALGGTGVVMMLVFTDHVALVAICGLIPVLLLAAPRVVQPWLDWRTRMDAIRLPANDLDGLYTP